MKKLKSLVMCALMLALVFVAASVLAEATEADFAITLTADVTEVNAGQKVTLTAEFANPDAVNKAAKNNQITWTVTDEAGGKTKAASVNANGVVNTQRNIKEKTVLVATAAAKSMPSQTASVIITVIPVASKVTIQTDTDLIYLQEGYNTARLTAVIEPADAAQAVTWQSANEKVATVDENGVVTAVSQGTVNITATAADGSKVKGSVRLTVGVPVGMLNSMSCSSTSYLQAGKGNLTFSIREYFDTEGNKITPTNKNITWSVQTNPASALLYVSIDGKGKLTADKDCPAAEVTVTAAADGSLPAGSATYSMKTYVIPAATAEVVPAASMDDFWGDWHVFMTADAKGNPKDPTAWMNKLGGVVAIDLRILEADGKPGLVVFVNGESYTGYYVHLADNALYLGEEGSGEDSKLAELCADGTLLQYVVYSRSEPDVRVYCFPVDRDMQSISTGEGEEEPEDVEAEGAAAGSALPEDLDPDALLEAVTEATDGIPDALGNLGDRYDLEKLNMLVETLKPMNILSGVFAEGTCTFPALDGEWPGSSPLYWEKEGESGEVPLILDVYEGQVTLTRDDLVPSKCTAFSMTLNYSQDIEVHWRWERSSGQKQDDIYARYYITGEANGIEYSYVLIPRPEEGSTHITINFNKDGNYMGFWSAEYDENGMLMTKEYSAQ